uniref:Putative ovule protein n=1 Tax=Solanum chacoense TaxID=4108 RepID=A0A0V0GXJ6_SOLCH
MITCGKSSGIKVEGIRRSDTIQTKMNKKIKYVRVKLRSRLEGQPNSSSVVRTTILTIQRKA